MAQTYSSKGKVFLTQHQFDSRKDAGTLQTGVEYMIIDDPNTIELSDGSISLLASNGVMIIGKSAEKPYLTIGTGNQVLVDRPQVDRQVANKKYVDDGLANKQNKLKAIAPIYANDEGTISLNFGNGLYTNSSNNLDVDWSRIPIDTSSPLYFNSCNNKGLNISASSPLYANSCNLGINYGHGLNKISVTGSNGEVTTVLGVDCESSSPLYINDNNKLSLKCSSPLYIDTSNDNKLSVNISELASNIAGGGLYESSNKLNVNIDTIFNEVLYDGEGKPKTTGLSYDSTTTTLKVATGDGLQYNGTTQKLEVNFSTVANTIAGYGLSYNGTNGKIESDTYTTTTSGQRYFSSGYLTTLRAKINGSNACRIKFRESANANINDTLWIELTYCDGYAWGMTVESSNGSTEYFNYNYSSLKVDTDKYEIVDINGSTFESSAQEAFITETKVR